MEFTTYSWAEWLLFAKCLLITMATILGIGILSLPVKVANSGLGPFLATFVCALFCQLAVNCFIVELLQRTETVMLGVGVGEYRRMIDSTKDPLMGRGTPTSPTAPESRRLPSPTPPLPSVPTPPAPPETTKRVKRRRDPESAEEEFTAVGMASTGTQHNPNLHSMAQCFLPSRIARGLFDLCVYLHFLIVMIAYAISASNAFGKLLEVDRAAVVPPFVLVLTAVVIIGEQALQGGVAIFTFVKAGLLVFMIIVVGYVASKVQRTSTSDWSAIGEPFLIGTVSLGGAVNVLPVVYASMERSPRNISIFRQGCCAGTVVCWVLNVLWTYHILSIVPQKGPPGVATLEEAYKKHDIATIPLLQFLRQQYPEYSGLGVLVNIFILISVTVSFIALGLGLTHYLDGAVAVAVASGGDGSVASLQSMASSYGLSCLPLPSEPIPLSRWRHATYVFSFGFILVVALYFAHSLYVILEVFNSLLLNLETGVFIGLMAWYTRFHTDDWSVPATIQLSKGTAAIGICITCTYFGLAVLYDACETAYNLSVHGKLH